MTRPISRNMRAFLHLIAVSEIGWELLRKSDNGYDVLVGSTPAVPKLFRSYSQHPRVRDARMNSDAAGRYQFLGRYWDYYRRLLALPDFGPESQDRWAIHLIGECQARSLVEEGSIPAAIEACRSRWASFPGAGYRQRENSLPELLSTYTIAGGMFA